MSLRGEAEAIHNIAKIRFNNGILKEVHYLWIATILQVESRKDEVGKCGCVTL
ncbi:hypothetical protein [Helicobacter rodentium]|uniref:hypothetical protein n=1 Tax=Helicobacter rodentium TaxID=59617 RepID=UPI000A986FFE|nr:hypothetical protein [Helicobacter rodentium]